MTRSFQSLAEEAWASGRHVCVGLDVDPQRIPSFVEGSLADRVVNFAISIVDATFDVAAAFKPNAAFFEALGPDGPEVLERICRHIRTRSGAGLLIADAKRADIANTNLGSVAFIYDYLGADAVTIHPYLGQEAVRPFLEYPDKGVFVLCRTSNPGSGEFQDLEVSGMPLYIHVAKAVEERWNPLGNCGLVVGATHAAELSSVRRAVPDLPLLIPGIGAQGGDLEATVRAATNRGELRAFINASRSVIYASSGRDFAEAARAEVVSMTASIQRVLSAIG